MNVYSLYQHMTEGSAFANTHNSIGLDGETATNSLASLPRKNREEHLVANSQCSVL
jgi:hypothetical protein